MLRLLAYRTQRGFFQPVRRRRVQRPPEIVLWLAVIGAVIAAAALWRLTPWRHDTLQVVWAVSEQIARAGAEVGPALGGWLSMDAERGKALLQQSLPMVVEAGWEPRPHFSWRHRVRSWLYMALNYDIARPETLVESVLPHPLAPTLVVNLPPAVRDEVGEQLSQPEPAGEQAAELPDGGQAERSDVQQTAEKDVAGTAVRHADHPTLAALQNKDWGTQPLVLIFHTHTAEMYSGSRAAEAAAQGYHMYNTTDTGIVRVGEVLARTLSSRYGIPVVHSKAIHDFPSYAHSYSNSGRTVKALLNKYPSIKVVIDVHRDAAENVSYVREVNGMQVSQVMLVVSDLGRTQPNLHPNWQRNVQFANSLEEAVNQLYPGLLRRKLTISNARYNQHLHPNMVLLEVGNAVDDELYALRTAALIADCIALVTSKVQSSVTPVRNTPALAPAPAPAPQQPTPRQPVPQVRPATVRPAPAAPRP